MQKYVETIERLLEEKSCDIKIFKNMSNTFTVKVSDGGHKGFGTHKQYRRALCLAEQDFDDYKGK